MRSLALPTSILLLLAGCSDDDTAPMDSSTDRTVADTSTDAQGDANSDAQVDASGDAAADVDSDGSSLDRMSFFVTSTGNGANGRDFGGIAGADARCAMLAQAAGSAATWRAYLSVEGPPVVHARDRIGEGPWRNARLEVVAASLAALHADGIPPAQMFDENGNTLDDEVPGQEHDILTGSNEDGTLFANRTCADWTSSRRQDRGQVGHHDWSIIPNPITPDQSWNSVHDSRCNEAGLISVLGSGRLYCFAID